MNNVLTMINGIFSKFGGKNLTGFKNLSGLA